MPAAISNKPRIKNPGRMTNAIMPIYGFWCFANISIRIRNKIKPKLTEAIAAPVNVIGLYTDAGKIRFMILSYLKTKRDARQFS